jgi:hypothetical protein
MKQAFIFVGAMFLLGGLMIFLLIPHLGFAQDTGQPADEFSDPLIPPSQMQWAPTSTTITLGTPQGSVVVNNFYESSVGGQEQYIILKQNTEYEINYDTYVSSFYIYFPQTPTDATRAQAESDFLSALGIDKANACRLTVAEGVRSPDPSSTDQTLPLSFCASNTFSQ